MECESRYEIQKLYAPKITTSRDLGKSYYPCMLSYFLSLFPYYKDLADKSFLKSFISSFESKSTVRKIRCYENSLSGNFWK